MSPEVYFFGCWDTPGHYLVDSRRRSVRDPHGLGIPSDATLDGTRLFLPYPERKGVGALTYLPQPDLSILAWWGSPWDTRGAVNNAVMVRGNLSVEEVWTAFSAAFPRLAEKLQCPEVSR